MEAVVSAALDSDESKLNEARRNRLRGLVAQLGLSRAEAAALLRAVANEVAPSTQYRQLRSVANVVAANNSHHPKSQKNQRAERQRRYRQRRKLDLRTLRAYPAIADEDIAILVQCDLLPEDAVDKDTELVDALVDLVRELAAALKA